MSRLLKFVVIGLATMLSLLTLTPSAHAAGNSVAAHAAATWIANHADSITKVGEAADAALALAAAPEPASQQRAESLLALIQHDGAAAVAESPESAAKLIIVAAAYGRDPHTFVPGVDLVDVVTAGIADDGSFGAWPGPFASGLAVVALDRAGEPVPESLITHLLTYANPDGGFGYAVGQPSDADNTGVALMALIAARGENTQAATDKARDWAEKNQADDGSWPGFNPVNSTAMMGGALATLGVDQTDSIAYLAGVQTSSGAFTSNGADDMLATTQATLLLAGVSYLDVDATLNDATDTAEGVEEGAAETVDSPARGANPMLPWLVGGGVVVLVVVVGVAWVLLHRARSAR